MKNVFLWFGLLIACSLEASTLSPDVLRSGDVRKLRAALDAGASATAPDTTGNTPLMVTAVYGDLASLRLLIER